jgi:hypothetical protein
MGQVIRAWNQIGPSSSALTDAAPRSSWSANGMNLPSTLANRAPAASETKVMAAREGAGGRLGDRKTVSGRISGE